MVLYGNGKIKGGETLLFYYLHFYFVPYNNLLWYKKYSFKAHYQELGQPYYKM